MTKIDDALAERMVALVRKMGDEYQKANTPGELAPFSMRNFQEARYIQRHLPAPVDPLLVEAREACACLFDGSSSYHFGERDGRPEVIAALAALRRAKAAS